MVTPDNILQILAVIVTSYLLGSLPTAYLIARSRNIDIFDVGSGNMGGTNIARTLGLGWGLLTSGIDICKGVAAVLLSRIIMPEQPWVATTIASIVVIVGHNWSLFATLLYHAAKKGRLTIRGGKGAATAFGTMLMVAPVQTIVGMLAAGLILILITRYVSLGVLTAFTLATAWVMVLIGQQLLPVEYIAYGLALMILLIWRFRSNIQRLITGTERRLGEPA